MQVSVDFPSSPTDHLLGAVYTTLDDTSEVWDLIPMMEFLIEHHGPNRISFLVTGVYKFRVGVHSSGSPDIDEAAREDYGELVQAHTNALGQKSQERLSS